MKIYRSPLNANDKDRVLYTQALPHFADQLTGSTIVSVNEEDELEELLEGESC